MVTLADRGATFVVDTGPPSDPAAAARPPLLLLHALACTGLLTWYPSLSALAERYRVVLFDQRWHGQGISSDRFDLDECADDTVAVADALGIERFIAVGYSMGSLVGQLAWHRHPARVAGAVLCATASRFTDSKRDPAALRAVSARLARAAVRRRAAIVGVAAADAVIGDHRWAFAQFRSTPGRRIAGAAAAISRFDSSSWIGGMNVPAAVVVTAHDRVIPPARQRWLARQIPDAAVYEVDGGHAACVLRADRFTPAVQAACASVAARASVSGPQ
jgi:diacylglycerol O-acyltransferase